MRILVLTNYDVGLYKFRKELLQELLLNNEVFVSLPKGMYTNSLKELGCKFIETDVDRRGTNIFADLKLLLNYLHIIKNIKPNVVLTYTIKPNVYGGIVCAIKHIPYIVNITGLGSALENESLIQKITLFLYKVGLCKATKVFFQNKDNLDFMINHKIVKDNYEIIPGSGVNTNEYKVTKYPNDKITRFVFVGRTLKEKGFELYLNAAKYIKEKYNDTEFHICGLKEDNYTEIIDSLTKNNIIIYHGQVDDMKTIYENINCTIHPTYYPEGLSNVLLESLACGRPIITTDRPGCKEVVDDGINGFIVKQKDENDLIEKIEKFIALSNKEKKQLGLNGRKKIEQYFDRNIVVEKYIKAINKIKEEL